jgi:hypothetical protein
MQYSPRVEGTPVTRLGGLLRDFGKLHPNIRFKHVWMKLKGLRGTAYMESIKKFMEQSQSAMRFASTEIQFPVLHEITQTSPKLSPKQCFDLDSIIIECVDTWGALSRKCVGFLLDRLDSYNHKDFESNGIDGRAYYNLYARLAQSLLKYTPRIFSACAPKIIARLKSSQSMELLSNSLVEVGMGLDPKQWSQVDHGHRLLSIAPQLFDLFPDLIEVQAHLALVLAHVIHSDTGRRFHRYLAEIGAIARQLPEGNFKTQLYAMSRPDYNGIVVQLTSPPQLLP